MSAAPDVLKDYVTASRHEAECFGQMLNAECMVALAKKLAEDARKKWVAAKDTVDAIHAASFSEPA